MVQPYSNLIQNIQLLGNQPEKQGATNSISGDSMGPIGVSGQNAKSLSSLYHPKQSTTNEFGC